MITRFISPGDFRTAVVIKKESRECDSDGYPMEAYESIFKDENGGERAVKCKWVNSHGTEVLTALQLGYTRYATLIMRYHPLITDECVIFKQGEKIPYRILSINNIEDRGRWIEIKVTKKSQGGN